MTNDERNLNDERGASCRYHLSAPSPRSSPPRRGRGGIVVGFAISSAFVIRVSPCCIAFMTFLLIHFASTGTFSTNNGTSTDAPTPLTTKPSEKGGLGWP